MKIFVTITLSLLFITSPLSKLHASDSLKIGVQLWSVRDDLSKDFEGTIKKIAEMGIQGVELAGVYGKFADDPKALAEFIGSHGMQVIGTHTIFNLLTDDKLDETMTFYQQAGVKTALIGWDDRAFSQDTVWKTIADLNRLQPKVEAYGIKFGYHNHAQEFANYRDVTLWDHIARSTPNSLVMQLDAGWASYAGKNPTEFVRKYPGRTLSIHIKAAENESDKGNVAIIGQDSTDWVSVIKANIEVGDTEWLILEQEEYPNGLTPLQALAKSKNGLDKILATIKQ